MSPSCKWSEVRGVLGGWHHVCFPIFVLFPKQLLWDIELDRSLT